MNSYRVTFGGEDIDYKSNFQDCLKHIPTIRDVFSVLRQHGVKQYWHFFEPYVEITWISPDWEDTSLDAVADFLRKEGIKFTILHDKGLTFPDWYCCSQEEKMFGCFRYAMCSKQSMFFHANKKQIDSGKGLENHYVRSCHVLASQLALNYKKEGTLLIKRGILCLLFWFLGHKKAVWIYTKIMRQKY